jgi:TRAP-type C4-dicarboxylate transport system substrate-binding protein
MRKWLVLPLVALLASACGGSEGTGSTEAEEEAQVEPMSLRLSTLVGPTTPDSETLQWWAEQLSERTEGAIDVEFFFGGSLLPGEETMAGVADGRADLGLVPTSFHPGELPLSSISSIPFVTSNTGAYTSTFKELFDTHEPYTSEWLAQGVVPVVWLSNPPPIIGLRNPVESLDDLDGLQIRTFGYITEAMDAVGVNAVGLPAGEIYEAVQRGVLDGYTAVPFEFVTTLALHEVAPHIVGADLGQYGITSLVMRQDLWDELPDSVRETIQELQEEVIARQQDQFREIGAEVCDTLRQAGATVTLLPEDDIESWKDTVGDSLFERWESDVSANGVDAEAADEFREAYLGLLEERDSDWEVQISVETCAEA